MAYCNTVSPDWEHHYATQTFARVQDLQAADDGAIRYTRVRYINMYTTANEKIPVERVRAGHAMLNAAYSNQNVSELAKVPETSLYPMRSVIGNPNILFGPLDPADVEVIYYRTNTRLDNRTPVEDAKSRFPPQQGVINVYIGSVNGGNILGQAELGGNSVFVLYSTVGGYDAPGTLTRYHLNKTLIHEIGHALNLPHVFSDDSCDGRSVYHDVPETIRPNFTARLVQDGAGEWSIHGDNRANDRANGTRTSCLYAEANPDTAPNDFAINYMDYLDDENSVMFTQSQALIMRDFLQNGGAVNLVSMTEAQNALTGDSLNEGSSSALSTTSMIIVSLTCVLVALMLGGLILQAYLKNKEKSGTDNMKLQKIDEEVLLI